MLADAGASAALIAVLVAAPSTTASMAIMFVVNCVTAVARGVMMSCDMTGLQSC